MASSKRWVVVAALLVVVGLAIYLLSNALQAFAGASRPAPREGPVSAGAGRQSVAINAQGTLSTGLMAFLPLVARSPQITVSSGTTAFLPLAALNSGGPPPPFGIQMYGRLHETSGLAQVAEAGARWVRVPVSWASAEPENCTPDQYHWATIDGLVQALTSEGLEPLLTLSGNPRWAAVYPMGPVTNVADLQEFMGALVERFDGDGDADAPGSPVVRYWEMYNEPDITDESRAETGGYGFFGYKGDQYAALLDAVYPVVKSASARAQLVFGGISHDTFDFEGGVVDPDFIDDVLTHCVGPCFDVFNFHYFPFYRWRWEGFGKDLLGKINYIRLKLDYYGFYGPIMVTETTWPSASWGNETVPPRYVISGYVRALAAKVLLLNWYAWRDIDSSLPGLLDNDLNPKPAYYAYQTLTAQLSHARFVRALTVEEIGGGNLEGYVFDVRVAGELKRLDVLWYDCIEYVGDPPGGVFPADCPPGSSQALALTASSVRVTDMLGNSSLRHDVDDGALDGHVVLEIGPDPVFVMYNPLAPPASLRLNDSAGAPDAALAEEAAPQGLVSTYPNCRFGVGASSDISSYDVAPLNLGWYVDWHSTQEPQTPAGMDYLHTVRLAQVGTDNWALVSPSQEELTATVQANPAATWLIGNEPDSPFQDDMLPQAYARAYHDLYYWIKELDPAAQVGIGGIVQPTPLRFAYLDSVWDTYRELFADNMPVDLWNIHTFILRETINPPDPEPCGVISKTSQVWGAYVPPGSPAQAGELYCVRDQDNLDIFWRRIRDFREWMAQKGQREKPLIITEYGVLFPETYFDEDDRSFSQSRVGLFMTHTFDLMLHQTDPQIGYPYDADRLVQRWAWFSLSFDPDQMGGALFDPDTHELRPLGEAYGGYASALPPAVDLLITHAYPTPLAVPGDDAPVTVTLKAVVSNIGNISTTRPLSVAFYAGQPGAVDTQLIGALTIHGGLRGCADLEAVQMAWKDLALGQHPFFVEVSGVAGEPLSNNVAQGSVLVAAERDFLPFVFSER